MFDFEIKIAQTQDEIEAAQKLRFEVFYLEDQKRTDSKQNAGLDIDKFDEVSKHLIIIDKTKNIIVGTYRLLLSGDTKQTGFHSEKIFDISNIKKINEQLLELGRSCIHKDYRNRAVINLLWNGIAWQVKKYNVKYIFGCPRLGLTDPNDVSEAFNLLKNKYYAQERFRVYPLSENVFRNLKEDVEVSNPKRTFRKLSPLIKGYLNIGALVCSYPAVYHEFGSVILFMLLPTDKMIDPYGRHFFGDDTK
ncbi:MAG: GNAT family N-acetyltransferase [Candidatus Omnitrophica bacterium]|nr:GNAT family N-acetyltransferase [Candidatus Omnitrophota bacterium]